MQNPQDPKATRLTQADLMKQVGHSGLLAYSGYIVEDPAPSGDTWTRIYQSMRDSSPIIGAMLTAFETLTRPVVFTVEPPDDSPQAADVAQFIDDALADMDQTWEDVLTEILTMLPFGWSLLEQVYKRRKGYVKDPATGQYDPNLSSRYSDGKIGWAKWSLRSQETRLRWEFDDNGNTLGMWQLAPPHYQTVLLPMEKCLLFRTTTRRGNPEGRSILRNSYRPYSYMEKIERLEGIGIERDLAGMPVYGVPASVMALASSNAQTPDVAAALATVQGAQQIVQNLRRDTMDGVVMPTAYDEHGHELYYLKLLSTGGARQFDTDRIIQRYGHQIVMSVLADFIYIGHEARGSFALIEQKTKLFTTALEGYLASICAVVNTYAIPRLLRYNGIDLALAPQLTHGEVGDVSLTELSALITGMAAAGMIAPNDTELINYVRAVAHLPSLPQPGEVEQDESAIPEDQSEEVPA